MTDTPVFIGAGNKAVALTAIVYYRYQPATDAETDKPAKPARLKISTYARYLQERSDTKQLSVVNENLVFLGEEADQVLAQLVPHTAVAQ